MEFNDIQSTLGLLNEADIRVCVVGEIALNYYNASRIIHDLELCVPARDLEAAASILASQENAFENATENETNIYTDYKKGFPRFHSCINSNFNVVIFPDEYYHLEPLAGNIIIPEDQSTEAEFSVEILDSFSPDEVATLPLPRFAPLFKGLCRAYVQTAEVTAAIAAELLVDGMDVGEDWCKNKFLSSENEELQFALRLVRSKRSRIADFTPNEVTCFIVDEIAAKKVRQIPGFNDDTSNLKRRSHRERNRHAILSET